MFVQRPPAILFVRQEAASCRSLLAAWLMVLLAGCATLPRNAVPVDAIYTAEVPGMPGIRPWGGQLSPEFQADAVQSVLDEPEDAFPRDATGARLYGALALSGGGSDGAFGAGFLYGWSELGTRPDFKLVTGISTGALIAPFAFLGPDFDQELKEVYTTITTESILERLNIFKIIFSGESFARTDPLRKLVAQHITGETLAAVAARHDRGHRLYIGTTHMDAQHLSIWNMGRIAKSGEPGALDLFRDILVASASIPAAFPPVLIEVEADGKRYDEMHTDGGTVTQVFFYAGVVDLRAAAREALGKEGGDTGELYIIRNGQLNPEPEQVRRKLADISDRAVSTMIKTAALNNLYRIYTFAQRDGIAFNYVDIPDDFDSRSKEPFDQAEMNRLFDVGYRLALTGEGWQRRPPGLAPLQVAE
jgi:hypothetical protein